MGVSASSLLDDVRSHYIKSRADAELQDFSPFYRKQFSVARFCQAEEDLDQQQPQTKRLLCQKTASQDCDILYEDALFYFDDTRKWKERYVVVRANYCLECHDCLESFVKGFAPRHKLLPTGGAVLTTEESYMAMVDKCFPDVSGVKEDFVPPLSGTPAGFPVYLRLPYRRDSYFCFSVDEKRHKFIRVLEDCIRHQNQDFLKRTSCEVQAFHRSIHLYRQAKGKFQSWDMLIGSDVRVLSNVVMEQLLPFLEKDLLPRLKAKKTERKRVWFATVEAAYILVQERLLQGLAELKEECRAAVRQQEVLIHSDMDQILKERRHLEEQIRAKVSGPAERLCSDGVQPYLGSVLDEVMAPVSLGFLEGRQLSEANMDAVCHSALQAGSGEELKKLAPMQLPDLQSCYRHIGSLDDKLRHLQDRFGFTNRSALIHGAQIDLQQLVENAAFTFQNMQQKSVQENQENPENAAAAMEKAKHRVLKQYDYDSSTVRKKIFQDALVSITLPFIKEKLETSCRTDLDDLEKLIDVEHSAFVHVDNVYEGILLKMLNQEVTKVVKQAASLNKYNLITDSRDLLSRSSLSNAGSPAPSTASPGSPAPSPASPGSPTPSPASPGSPALSPTSTQSQGPSPRVVHSLTSDPQQDQPALQDDDILQAKTLSLEPAAPEPDLFQAAKSPDAVLQREVGPILTQDQVQPGQPEEPPTVLEPQTEKQEAETSPSETPAATLETSTVQAQIPEPGPDPANEAVRTSAEEPGPNPDPCSVNLSSEVAKPEPELVQVSEEGLVSEVGNTSEESGPGSKAETDPKTTPEPCQETGSESTPKPTLEPGQEAVQQHDLETVPEPGQDVLQEPSQEPGPKPASEPGQEAVLQPGLETVPEPAQDVLSEPSLEPGPESAPKPASEPGQEAVLQPGLETVPEPAQDVLSEPSPDAAAEVAPAVASEPVLESAPEPDPDPVDPPAEDKPSPEVLSVQIVAPSGDEASAEVQAAESVAVSDPKSLDASAGSDSPPSDLESTDEVSTTSEILEEERLLSKSPLSSDEDKTASGETSPQVQTDAVQSADEGRRVDAGASVEAEDVGVSAAPPQPIRKEETAEARPPDCIKGIRELVEEVIEVEEVLQRYPDGIPKEE